MKIAIFGLGALGSNLLVQLAKQYPEFEYTGIDFDKVEGRNIRTQAFFLEQVGLHKADAIRVILSRFLRRPKYTPVKQKITEPPYKISLTHNLLIDCFDNSKSRDLITKTETEHTTVLHVGFSPFYTAEMIWDEDYDVPNDVDSRGVDICEQTDAVSFIHFVVNATVLNISDWINNKARKNIIITNKNRLKWL